MTESTSEKPTVRPSMTPPMTTPRHWTMPVEVPVHLQLIVGSDEVSRDPPLSPPPPATSSPIERASNQKFFTQPTIPFRKPNNWYFPSTAEAREEHRGIHCHFFPFKFIDSTIFLNEWMVKFVGTYQKLFWFFRWIDVLCDIDHNRSVFGGRTGADHRRHQFRGFLSIETNGLAIDGTDDAVRRCAASERFGERSHLPQRLWPETGKGRNTEGFTPQRYRSQFFSLSYRFPLSGSLELVGIRAPFFLSLLFWI